jgi:adenylate cyclase
MMGTRKIAAILVADIAGYSRLAEAVEDHTLSRPRGLRRDLIAPANDAHQSCDVSAGPIGKQKINGRSV